MNFQFHSPTKIIFGSGSLETIGVNCKTYGDRVLIVSGKNSMKKYNHLKIVTDSLKKEKIFFEIFNNISPDAKSHEINEGIALSKKFGAKFIIGLGGGSSIDAAKAVAVGQSFSKIEEIIGKTINDDVVSLPIVAVPSTSGTGSEVSKGSIVTDSKKNFKSGIRGEKIFPKLAIIDPNLSLSMPENLALETGFDAFTHLLESYLARKSTRLSQIYSEFGLELIFKNLPKIIDKPNDIKIRANISLGALIGGINVANASTCLPHRLQQAMGSVPEIHHPHARGLACLYPSWLKEVFPETKKKFEKLREVLKVSDDGYDFIIKFMEKIKVNNRLKDYGVKESYINIFVKNISGNVENDPIKEINETLIKRIYTNSI